MIFDFYNRFFGNCLEEIVKIKYLQIIIECHETLQPVVYSARYLPEWITDHPLKDYSEAPLWIKLTGKMRLQAVGYKDVRTQLKKIAGELE